MSRFMSPLGHDGASRRAATPPSFQEFVASLAILCAAAVGSVSAADSGQLSGPIPALGESPRPAGADPAGRPRLDPYHVYFYADFDEDGDPWTLRTSVESDSAVPFDLILEPTDDSPSGSWYWALLIESACPYTDPWTGEDRCWYRCRITDFRFDPVFVSEGNLYKATVPCTPDGIDFTIAPDAPLVPGERSVIATGTIRPFCGPPPPGAEGCSKDRRELRIWFKALAPESSPDTMRLVCPAPADLEPEDGVRAASGSTVVGAVRLGVIRPNPAFERVTIPVLLEEPAWIRVTAHDAGGRLVAVLFDGEVSGPVPVSWDLREAARPVAAGIYAIRVDCAKGTAVRRIVVLR